MMPSCDWVCAAGRSIACPGWAHIRAEHGTRHGSYHVAVALPATRPVRENEHMSRQTAPAGISAREAEVLTLVGEHRSNAEIGAELYISGRPGEPHRSSCLPHVR